MRKMTHLILLICISTTANSIEIIEPTVETQEQITIVTQDANVATLGKVEFVIDFQAARDSLFELKIRRAGLTLEDGRLIDVFGYDKEAGIIVGAAAPVSHVSISGKDDNNVLALFHNDKGEVFAPAPQDLRAFDLDLAPKSFAYTPSLKPSAKTLDVSILIDRSGSMLDTMDHVVTATRTFMANLPDFTRCRVYSFGNTVERLTPADALQLQSCQNTLSVLDNPIPVGGGTALFAAIKEGISVNSKEKSNLPNLVIVLTDGISSEREPPSMNSLLSIKDKAQSKLLVFWAGDYDPKHLVGLADIESVSTQNVKADLDGFFQTIGVSVSGMQTLTLK